jgi:photosynthetic reaction center cytochrome c subunit
MTIGIRIALALAAFAFVALVATSFERPPMQSAQRGYRGLGIVQVTNPRIVAAKVAANPLPEAIPAQPPSGTPASSVYQNVQVLKDVDSDEFMRLMGAITAWVSPEQGCAYCHSDDLAADTLYTKAVARRMLQMTQSINANWKTHVASTGVTCYTCHRGQPVPANIWFTNPGPAHAGGMAADRAGKNAASSVAGFSALPFDPFTPFLEGKDDIRVVSTTALPQGSRRNIKETESTYGLMMHFSKSLGVNCTYCHNSRSFFDWDQSSPQRATAWYGIRMMRNLNADYLDPLKTQFPSNRLGPVGDGPKVNCLTCHQGVYKPLFGASLAADFPELGSGAK